MILIARALTLSSLFAASALAQGTVTPYGCGVNPTDSLTHESGDPIPGGSLSIALFDPTGSKPAGSIALLLAAAAPDPAYPCGTPLAGFGLGAAFGELLLDLSAPVFHVGTAIYPGGGPVTFALDLPGSPTLAGKHLFLQGALGDAVGGTGIGLTNGLDVRFGDVPPCTDLAIRSVWVEPIPVAPGEPVRIHAVVENRGDAASKATEVAISFEETPVSSVLQQVPGLAPGQQFEVVASYATSAAWKNANPHWPSVVLDPAGALDECDEANNAGGSNKPAFVVDIVPPAIQAPIPEHADFLELEGGIKLSHTTETYGEQGGESIVEYSHDPDKQPWTPSGDSGQPRIDPSVQLADELAQPGEMLVYHVKVHHGVPMPRLPQLVDTTDRFSQANITVLEQRLGMFEGLRRARVQAAQPLAVALEAAGGTVLEHFTLSGSMLVAAPKGYLGNFAADALVQYVESDEGYVYLGDVSDARAHLQSDAYFDGGATGRGYVAILDSGVRKNHDLLSSPSHISWAEDCVDGNGNCDDTGKAGYSHFDADQHGTSVAAIVTANGNYGSDDRGFSDVTIDCWRLSDDATGQPTTKAIHRGFDEAVFWGDQIINCSFGGDTGPSGSVADDADNAFDSGSAVICANGNDGGGSETVDSPAVAHKAIGVGVYDVDTMATQSYQSDGPTSDDRIKPDVQAPTNVFTALSTGDSAMWTFGGTSCATPTITGAAAVYLDWFGFTSLTSANAGKLYAALINGGVREWDSSTPFNNKRGVGPTELPIGGSYWTGSRNVGRFENEYVTIDVPDGATLLSAAIWWGENPGNSHRDIDLYLQRPDGSTSDKSIDGPSVFEHLEVTDPITPGTRKVRIYGYDVPIGKTVTVYYAIHVEH